MKYLVLTRREVQQIDRAKIIDVFFGETEDIKEWVADHKSMTRPFEIYEIKRVATSYRLIRQTKKNNRLLKKYNRELKEVDMLVDVSLEQRETSKAIILNKMRRLSSKRNTVYK